MNWRSNKKSLTQQLKQSQISEASEEGSGKEGDHQEKAYGQQGTILPVSSGVYILAGFWFFPCYRFWMLTFIIERRSWCVRAKFSYHFFFCFFFWFFYSFSLRTQFSPSLFNSPNFFLHKKNGIFDENFIPEKLLV